MEVSASTLEKHAESVADDVNSASNIVFFTGAGISTESGIADFRSPGGIWSKIKPIHFEDFVADEDTRLEDWRRRFHFQPQFENAPVNDGHMAIAEIMNTSRGQCLITQNIDGLHQRSGVEADAIIELHGNGTKASCLECRSPMSLERAAALIEETGSSPKCERCNGLVKADVISFGQPMPQIKLLEAVDRAKSCDLFIVLGSSLVVQPAARLPVLAQQAGAKLIIVNRESTPLDDLADEVVQAPIGQLMKKVLEKLSIWQSP